MRSYRSSILWKGMYWATTFAQTSSNVSGDLSLSICDVRGATNIREQHSRGADAILESTEVYRGKYSDALDGGRRARMRRVSLTGWMRLREGGGRARTRQIGDGSAPLSRGGDDLSTIPECRSMRSFSFTKAGCSSDSFFLLPLSWCYSDIAVCG